MVSVKRGSQDHQRKPGPVVLASTRAVAVRPLGISTDRRANVLGDPGLDSVDDQLTPTSATGYPVTQLDRALIGDEGVGSVATDSPDVGVSGVEGSREPAPTLDDVAALLATGVA